jgi:hypothetical protein
LVEFQALGLDVRKVDVDVDDLVEWCKQRGLAVDAEARAQYVTEKIAHGRS